MWRRIVGACHCIRLPGRGRIGFWGAWNLTDVTVGGLNTRRTRSHPYSPYACETRQTCADTYDLRETQYKKPKNMQAKEKARTFRANRKKNVGEDQKVLPD